MVKKTYFGTDGIRGSWGEIPITPHFFAQIGQVLAHGLKKEAVDKQTVLVGRDTRISGGVLESALITSLLSCGIHVRQVGCIPVGAVAYLTRKHKCGLGIMISASHNPYMDNGLKFFSALGSKISTAFEATLEAGLQNLPPQIKGVNIEGQSSQTVLSPCSHLDLGTLSYLSCAEKDYIDFCKAGVSGLDLSALKIALDCAHGAAYRLAPALLSSLGANLVVMGDQPDGLNINKNSGATQPDYLAALVLREQCDLGLILDGDADRLLMVDAKGKIYNGDQLLYLLVRHLFLSGKYPLNQAVVGTLMSNGALEQSLKNWGISFIRTAVGDKYVLEALLENQGQLGAESSGHILCLNKHSTGDALVAALQVLSSLMDRGETLQEACSGLSLYPQILKNCPIPPLFNWENHPKIQAACQKVRLSLGSKGRLLVRPSGTEPLLRIMLEAPVDIDIEKHAQFILNEVESALK